MAGIGEVYIEKDTAVTNTLGLLLKSVVFQHGL